MIKKSVLDGRLEKVELLLQVSKILKPHNLIMEQKNLAEAIIRSQIVNGKMEHCGHNLNKLYNLSSVTTGKILNSVYCRKCKAKYHIKDIEPYSFFKSLPVIHSFNFIFLLSVFGMDYFKLIQNLYYISDVLNRNKLTELKKYISRGKHTIESVFILDAYCKSKIDDLAEVNIVLPRPEGLKFSFSDEMVKAINGGD